MAACWALEPAPLRVPDSCFSALLLAALPEPALDFSLDAPQAVSASAPASAIATGMARVVVLSFKVDASRWARTSMPGRCQRERR
jgi:hypothetical protein